MIKQFCHAEETGRHPPQIYLQEDAFPFPEMGGTPISRRQKLREQRIA